MGVEGGTAAGRSFMERIHSVYVARGTVNGKRCVLYVGSTTRGLTRFHEHAATRTWWPLMSTTSWYHRTSRKSALATERRLIAQLNPVFQGQSEDGKRSAHAVQ